jgi:uncharacterized protein YkwD
MVFQYHCAAAGAVTIDVKVGKVWKNIVRASETEPGDKTYPWDGRVGGKALRAGTYQVRLTGPDGVKLTKIRILPTPSVTVYALSPSKFKATGSSTTLLTVRWSQLCDVRIEIVNATGVSVRTLYAVQNRAAAKVKLRWDGRDDQGQLVPSGVYWVRAQCGGRKVTRKFTIISAAPVAPATPPQTTTTVTIPLGEVSTLTPEQQECRLVDLFNSVRQANGLQALAVNDVLRNGARSYSQLMADHNFFDHTSYGAMDVRMHAAGISYWYAGENLAKTTSADQAYEQFMGSTSHKENILKPEYSSIGVGYVWDQTEGIYYCTVWFATLQ